MFECCDVMLNVIFSNARRMVWPCVKRCKYTNFCTTARS